MVVLAPSVNHGHGICRLRLLKDAFVTASYDYQVNVEARKDVDYVVDVVGRPDREELRSVLSMVRLPAEQADGALERRSCKEAGFVKQAIERFAAKVGRYLAPVS